MKYSPGPLEHVATVQSRITNACVSRQGRVICGFPRWGDGFDHPAVAEITAGDKARSLLPQSWNAWAPGESGEERLVSVHALHLDQAEQLWVLDDGCPKLGTPVEGGPKVVQFDLASERIVRAYPLAPPATHASSILSHLRVDAHRVYVTDAGSGAILVIDRVTGSVRRVLDGHPRTQADPSIVPMINGKPYKSAHGKVATLHLSHIEISGDGQWMYFCPLFGPSLQRVPLASLVDERKSEEALAAEIERVCEIPPVAGIHAVNAREFLLCAATDGAILYLDESNELSRLVQDERICFPNEGGFGPGKRDFYFPNSGAHLIGRPFEVFKFSLGNP